MGSRYLTDLGDVLRRAGLTVIELDGWQTRARGSGGYDDGRPSVVMVHHTASPPSSSGEPDALYCALYDEDAPLSNLCLDRDGVWWILAAGATNTNGAGGPLAGVPVDSMNSHAIGIEANGGYGDAWPAVQTNAYVAGVAALCQAYGIGDVFAHFEWAPSRKIDPAGPSPWATGDESWNMDDFRADVDAGVPTDPGPGPGPGPEPKDDEMVWRVAKSDEGKGPFYIGDGTTAYTVGDAGHDVTNDEARCRMAAGAVNVLRCVWDKAVNAGGKAGDDLAGPRIVTEWGQVKGSCGDKAIRVHVGAHKNLT